MILHNTELSLAVCNTWRSLDWILPSLWIASHSLCMLQQLIIGKLLKEYSIILLGLPHMEFSSARKIRSHYMRSRMWTGLATLMISCLPTVTLSILASTLSRGPPRSKRVLLGHPPRLSIIQLPTQLPNSLGYVPSHITWSSPPQSTGHLLWQCGSNLSMCQPGVSFANETRRARLSLYQGEGSNQAATCSSRFYSWSTHGYSYQTIDSGAVYSTTRQY